MKENEKNSEQPPNHPSHPSHKKVVDEMKKPDYSDRAMKDTTTSHDRLAHFGGKRMPIKRRINFDTLFEASGFLLGIAALANLAFWMIAA